MPAISKDLRGHAATLENFATKLGFARPNASAAHCGEFGVRDANLSLLQAGAVQRKDCSKRHLTCAKGRAQPLLHGSPPHSEILRS
jgi:hypothetical protein